MTSYGTLVGYDTDFHQLKHGWHSVGTGYIGYNGTDTTMNGGRNGIALTAGFRWSLGNEGKPLNEKVENPSGREIVKQLTPAQRTA